MKEGIHPKYEEQVVELINLRKNMELLNVQFYVTRLSSGYFFTMCYINLHN